MKPIRIQKPEMPAAESRGSEVYSRKMTAEPSLHNTRRSRVKSGEVFFRKAALKSTALINSRQDRSDTFS